MNTLKSCVNDLKDRSSIWSGLLPLKVESFCWQVLHGKVAVKTNLAGRNGYRGNDVLCLLCGCDPESVQHLFFSCYLSWRIWSSWCAIWGIFWVGMTRLKQNFLNLVLVLDWGLLMIVINGTALLVAFLKCNVDATTVHNSSLAGVGIVIRGVEGKFVSCKMFPCKGFVEAKEA
ncbi:hypothetical protein PTKIN_Ptkin06aG0046500 [Pterospermum kingtungense]